MSCCNCTGASARHSAGAHWCGRPLRSCLVRTPRNARRSSEDKSAGSFTAASGSQTSGSPQEQEPKGKSRLKGVIQKLTDMGPSGIAAYGILNSMYYTGVVAFMFIAVLKVQPGIGLQQGAKKLGEAFLSAWALSQLTKGLIAIALACMAVVTIVMAFLLATVM